MNDLFHTIQAHDRAGNINRVIALACGYYGDLAPLRPELLERIVHYLSAHRGIISPSSVKALRSLPLPHREDSGISRHLESPAGRVREQGPGRIHFPVVTSIGMVREIHVRKAEPGAPPLHPARLALLDAAGAGVFRVLSRRMKRHCPWRPHQYRFDIPDLHGRDDLDVKGDSMGLPLALALYSLVTRTPVPPDVSATGAIARDGSVGPVGSVPEKIDALLTERFFIKRVLVPDREDIGGDPSGIGLLGVRSLDDAVGAVFPRALGTASFPASLDMAAEIAALRRQYGDYLFDTCMENAGELIRYLENGGSGLPPNQRIPALFACRWKKGCCHCHRGEARDAELALNAAHAVYRRNPGLIRIDDYFESRISYGVALKDVFRYRAAETLHLDLEREMAKRGCLDHTRAQNLSTLGQLYLAMGRFSDAAQYQRRAIRRIREDERYRNYGYLAQVHTRAGDFQKAARAFLTARRLLDRAAPDVRAVNLPFYHWMRAEYLYRRAAFLKKGRGPLFRELEELAAAYPEPAGYVSALIHKFAGLGLLLAGNDAGGLRRLDRAVRFFADQAAPVLRLLGASVRAGRALHFLRTDRYEPAAEDIAGIIADLSLQKDIKRFFKKDLQKLSRFLKSKRPQPADIRKAIATLEDIRMKIPY